MLFSLADGELYSGTSADFMGRDFAIFRTLGDHHPIRTEQHDSRWLNGKKKKKREKSIGKMNLSPRVIYFPGNKANVSVVFTVKQRFVCYIWSLISY